MSVSISRSISSLGAAFVQRSEPPCHLPHGANTALLHGLLRLQPWGLSTLPASPDGQFEETPTTNNVSAVLEAYGYGDPLCDVYRFWEPGFPIETTGANVLPLLVHCPVSAAGSAYPKGRVLAFVGSFGPKGLVNFELDDALGVGASSHAFDAETGAPVGRVAASNNFTFSLDKHSFKIIVCVL